MGFDGMLSTHVRNYVDVFRQTSGCGIQPFGGDIGQKSMEIAALKNVIVFPNNCT
jgi:hypothetical protein